MLRIGRQLRYGKGHYDVSVAVAEQSILSKITANPERGILADGFSCRTQVADLAGRDSRHLVQIIAAVLDETRTNPSLYPALSLLL